MDSCVANLIKNLKQRPLPLILILFAVSSLFYNRSFPAFEGPDEPQHFAYAVWLAEGRGLPPQGEEGWITPIQQEVGQAPLYYFIASLPVRLTDFNSPPAVFQRNPYFPSSAPGHIADNKNIAVHYPSENVLEGGWLALHLARGVSFLFGVLLVVCVYKSVQELFPESPRLAVVSALFTAVIPQVLFMSATVSNDIAAAATGALTLWLLFRLIRRGPTLAMGLAFGVAYGLATLSKTSSLALALPAAVGFLWLWLREKERRMDLLKAGLAAAVGAFVVAGWWYIRGWLLYGSPFGLGAHYLTPWALSQDFGRNNPFAEWLEVFYSLWAAFGWGNIKFPGWIYYILLGLTALAVIGLALRLKRTWQGWRQMPLWLLVSVLAVGAVAFALELWMRRVTAPHGRLLFPALAAIVLLLIMGWDQIHRWLTYAAVGYIFALTCLSLVLLIRPAYSWPDYRETAPAENVNQLNWQFGDFARLLSVTPVEASVAAGAVLPVSVCWETTGQAAEDYIIWLQVVGPENRVIAGRHTYPGLGSYPTSIWEAGRQFCDAIRVDIPADLDRTLQYQIEVGLISESRERVPAANADGSPRDSLFATAVRLETAEPPQIAQTPTGDGPIRLGEADFNPQWPPGSSQTVALRWLLAEAVNQNYTVFVHLRDKESGENVAQGDGPPNDGWYPTALWQTGEVVEDSHTVAVPADVAPGSYNLFVGWYDPVTGTRLGNESLLGTVEVVP